MDSSSYHEFHTIKLEKQKPMLRYLRFYYIGNFFRTLEIVVAIALVSYSFSFTSSFLPSASFFRRLSSLLFSPHFVFLVGNVIIITLFAKSSRDENNNASEYVGGGVSVAADESVAGVPPVVEVKEKEKVYRRTKSTANMVVVKLGEEAEKQEWKIKSPRRRESGRFEVDELSNEEFRRKVEAFIEKQQRFLRDEKSGVVLSN